MLISFKLIQLNNIFLYQYKCVAYNSVGEASFSGQINVIGGPMIRNYGSSVTNITCIAGRSAYLRCPIIGYPIDSLIWQYNGKLFLL